MTIRLGKRYVTVLLCLACAANFLYWIYIQSVDKQRKLADPTHDPWSGRMRRPAGHRDSQVDQMRAEAVKEMTKVAWAGYYHLCALGSSGNELAPVTNSCSPMSDSMVGPGSLLTVIDALDTLMLMGLQNEYKQGRDLVQQRFNPLKATGSVIVFETTIRMLGGLLGAFSLSEDPMFRQLAVQVADGMAGALESGSFSRFARVGNAGNQVQGEVKVEKTNLAEVGSLYLEFAYLSELAGDAKYKRWVDRYQQALMDMTSLDGILPIALISQSPWNLKPAGMTYSAGAGGDSFYEYLVKRCLFDAPMQRDCVKQFTVSLDGIMKHLAVKTPDNNVCLTSMTEGADREKKQCVMEHLTCFAGGMYAMAYLQVDQNRTDWLDFAEKVTRTCYLSYQHSETGIGPEIFLFDQKSGKFAAVDGKYLLRPELAESIYYLYQVTGKQMYRDWGWDIVRAINTSTRTGSGFSGLATVTKAGSFDNTQYSFFLAETLKYLYLLFAPVDRLRLDQWLFNTEAHLIPTRRNPLRQKFINNAKRLTSS